MSDAQQVPVVEQAESVAPLFEIPQEVTDPCLRFLAANAEMLALMQTFGRLAQAQENMARVWAEDEGFQEFVSDQYKRYLEESGNPAGEPENLDMGAIAEKLLAMIPKAEAVVAPHARLLNQMLLSRAVDNFLLYLAELLLLLYRTKLGAVKSEDSEIEEFIGSLAEQYVEGASFGGMKRLPGEFKDTFRMELFNPKTNRTQAERIIVRRNNIIHSRGIANRYFVRQFPEAKLKVGDPVPFDWDGVQADVAFLFRTVIDIDQRAAALHALPRVQFPRPKMKQAIPNDAQAAIPQE